MGYFCQHARPLQTLLFSFFVTPEGKNILAFESAFSEAPPPLLVPPRAPGRARTSSQARWSWLGSWDVLSQQDGEVGPQLQRQCTPPCPAQVPF